MQVELIYTNKFQKSKWVWAIRIYQTDKWLYKTDEYLDQWLCIFKTFSEAEQYCKENGYEIKSWGKHGIPNRY